MISKKLAPLSQTVRGEIKTIRVLVARFFSALNADYMLASSSDWAGVGHVIAFGRRLRAITLVSVL